MRRRLIADLILIAMIAAAAFALHAWVFNVSTVTSPSMLPTILPGDILLIERAPLAFRRTPPARGDIVVLQAPDRRLDATRIVGLPGDRIGLSAGRLTSDGKRAPRWRVADAIVPIDAALPCPAPRREAIGCRYPHFREMLPGGGLIDSIGSDAADITPISVPPGRILVLPDRRDGSVAPRLVAAGAIVGRARLILLSLDGTSRLDQWRSWGPAIRRDRTGIRF